MVTMKADKSGGCAVMSTLWAIAKLELPFEVHGIVEELLKIWLVEMLINLMMF